MKLDVVITGVGGQGTILTSRVIAQMAMVKGFEVRTSETIGMAQREGSVVSHVRIGRDLTGALIPDGKADILISLELAETVKGLAKLKAGGLILANTAKIIPTSVPLGLSQYQGEEIMAFINQASAKICFFDATKVALQAGNYKTVNVVFLGVLSTIDGLPFRVEEYLQAIEGILPPKVQAVNKKAFYLGRELALQLNRCQN
ncbi:MAG TPA: indolepyruvate oxidoreductase subunit beta [Desulfosporosinus sp.]